MVRWIGALSASAIVFTVAACGGHELHPDLAFSDAEVRLAEGGPDAELTVQIGNAGGADQLFNVETRAAERVALHLVERSDGQLQMVPTEILEVPEDGLVMSGETSHVMLEGIDPALRPGDTISVTFQLGRADDRRLDVPVVA